MGRVIRAAISRAGRIAGGPARPANGPARPATARRFPRRARAALLAGNAARGAVKSRAALLALAARGAVKSRAALLALAARGAVKSRAALLALAGHLARPALLALAGHLARPALLALAVLLIAAGTTGCPVGGSGIGSIVGSPSIRLFINNTRVTSGATVTKGDVNLGDSKTINLRVENGGNKTLHLTGTEALSFSGTHADLFSCTETLALEIAPNETTETNLVCSAGTSAGAISAELRIQSDDEDQNPFIVILEGTILSTSTDTVAPQPGGAGAITVGDIGPDTVELSWQAATDDESDQINLYYKVVRSETDNIGTPGAAEEYGTTVVSWSQDLGARTADSLLPETQYYFTVIVRDEADNKASYQVVSATTAEADPDITAPTPGGQGTVTVESQTEDSISITWTVATDDYTAEADLRYLVYHSSNLADVTDYAQAEANATPVGDWTKNKTTETIADLSPVSTNHINVFVKDERDNVAAYGTVTATTVDLTAPTAGGTAAGGTAGGTAPDPNITIDTVTTDSVQMNWFEATDNVTPTADLRYKVVWSDQNNISTVTEIETDANGTIVRDWSLHPAPMQVTGLPQGTICYFNVLVKDGAGQTSAYTAATATTHELLDALEIVFDAPADEQIELSEADDQILSRTATITVTITQTFTTYDWYLDGDSQNNHDHEFQLDCASLDVGSHTITAMVESETGWYAKTLWFTVSSGQ